MDLRLFEFENEQVRAVTIDDQPYFVGKDVAVVLGYTNPSKALNDHVDEEDKLNNETLSSLGQRGGWLINESGLYSLILSSKLPSAKKFKRWVTSEVLPTIRQTGGYGIPKTPEEQLALTMTVMTRQVARLDNVEEQVEFLVNQAGLTSARRYELNKARNKRVISLCDGYESNAYNNKSLRRKIYTAMAREFRIKFEVSQYADLPMKKFEEGKSFVANWRPNYLLSEEISLANSQQELF